MRLKNVKGANEIIINGTLIINKESILALNSLKLFFPILVVENKLPNKVYILKLIVSVNISLFLVQ